MIDIKIFVTHTPNRNSIKINNPLFYNVIAGSDFQTEPVPEGFYLDNAGDNISLFNRSYCELTTQYWAWKNQEADYYGFCHYRRFFNFNQHALKESGWGTIEYDYLDDKALEELHLNERDMRECIEKYDFLIAKGVEASSMNAKTIYNQYEIAPELHVKDIDLLIEIIGERYPELSAAASNFFQGKIFYPCNMFIMKKDIFRQYSQMLFDILEEFERRADMSNYSREGYRTTGHLGERLASIYYIYLKEQKKYRLGELQVALIHDTDAETEITTDCGNDIVPIVLAANQKYVPILYTCIQSILDHTTQNNQYQINIFHTDITLESQKKFINNLARSNTKITFVNVGKRVSNYILKAKQHISTETFYRFLILDILKNFPKVLYLDCDIIVHRDLAEVFHVELGDNLIGATLDADFAGQCNMKNSEMKQYCQNVLKIENPFEYFQAGVLVMNVKEMRKVTTVQHLLEMADTGIYRFSDQDILNVICKGRVTYLDMAWNMIFDCENFRWKNVIKYAPYYILDAYENSRKDPYIIHYAGFLKPWMNPDQDFASEFWEVARRTEYYEIILMNMLEYKISRKEISIDGEKENERGFIETLRKVARHFFPKDSKARTWAIGVYFKLKNLT